MGNDNTITFLNPSTKNSFTGILLRIKYNCRSFEMPETFINTSSLDNTTVWGKISEENRQTAIFRISMSNITDTTICTVCIQGIIPFTLTAHLC